MCAHVCVQGDDNTYVVTHPNHSSVFLRGEFSFDSSIDAQILHSSYNTCRIGGLVYLSDGKLPFNYHFLVNTVLERQVWR